jgi:hypothetical protein
VTARRAILPFLLLYSLGVAATGFAAGERGGVFLLPVEGTWPVGESAAAVFEERLAIALAESKHMRTVTQRDLPGSRRTGLPEKLSTCTAPDCVKKLAALMSVDRVLSIRVADDQGRTILFSALYEGRTGAVASRKEWRTNGREAVPPSLAGAIASWTVGEAPAPTPPPAKVEVVKPGVLVVGLAAKQADSIEARTLRGQVTSRLRQYGDFSVQESGAGPDLSHRATIAVEHMDVTTRPHHVHRYREGSLIATLTITEIATGVVTFSSTGRAEVREKTEHASDTEVVGTLVSRVVDQWMSAFDAQGIRYKLTRKVKQ